MLLAVAAVLATAPAAAAKKPGGPAAGGRDHVAQGQAKRAARAGPGGLRAAPVRDGAARVAAATADAKKNVKPSQAAKAKRPKPARAAARRSAAAGPADAVSAPVVAAPLTAPTAPIVTSAPAAPVAQAPTAGTRRAAARSPASPARRLRPARRSSTTGARAARPATRPVRAATTIATADAAPAGTRAGARRAAGGAADAPGERSPLTRTVVRVLEVVPPGLRVALAVLAGLGLLLAAATAVQTIRRRRLERQRRLLLADVGVLQSALLPELTDRIGGAFVTAAYRPAEGLAAGGDFYDAFELPGGRTAVLVGDVAGHGRDVVPLTALVRYNVRAYLEAGLAPRATVHVAANVLAPHLGDRQVTIVVAIFDPGTGRLTYACAGHPPPLLLGSAEPPVTVCSSPPIGAGAATGRRQTTIAFAPGAAACLHTDGLDEAPATFGRLGREGVAEELRALGPRPAADELIARVVRRSARQPDDMAACILTALPGGAASWSLRVEELEVDAPSLAGGWAERFLVACGVDRARIARALREVHAIIERDGTAVVEVRVGEALAEVRVAPPPAVTLPVADRRSPAIGTAATG